MEWEELIDDRIADVRRQRTALLSSIAELRQARSLTFADDEHDPDGSTSSLDQARDVALLAGVDATLAALDAARDRLTDGTFGRCQRCGQPIAVERLQARPEATRCIGCAGQP